MTVRVALSGCQVFDGRKIRSDVALLVDRGRIVGIVGENAVPAGFAWQKLAGGILTPGFVDLQVNGGGGVLFNDDTSVEAIKTICAAHLRFGTTALLPTLITDTQQKTIAAIAAAKAATDVPGCIGLHLEGPHLSKSRKGAHDAARIRKMDAIDLSRLTSAGLATLLTTIAPESVSGDQIAILAKAGIIVSLGHSDSSFDEAVSAVSRGATCITHLFNAMSGLSHRQPGMVGAALANGSLHVGLISDGVHVDSEAIGIALRAKRGPGHIFLVSDSMSNIGTDMTEFRLAGQTVRITDGRLVRADGTLAGANITMIAAVRFMVDRVGLDRTEALRMATLYPARVIGRSREFGCFARGARADVLHLSDQLDIQRVWQNGVESRLD